MGGSIRNRDRSMQVLPISKFHGGIALGQVDEAESEWIENCEIMRDGYLTSRLGSSKFNTGSLGSTMITGIDAVFIGGNGYGIVAKAGTTWYYVVNPNLTYSLRTAPTGAFTSFTVPTSPGDDPVKMETVVDSTGVNWAVFANKNFTGITKFNGTTASNISGSPAAAYVKNFGGRLYAAGVTAAPYTVYFSDAGNPFSWPTANQFNLQANFGTITGLERQPGMLIIFCKRGIWALRGNPPLSFTVDALHNSIGCDMPNTISTFGSVTAFCQLSNVYIMSGSVKTLTDKTNSISMVTSYGGPGAGGTNKNVYGQLTSNHFFLMTNLNTSVASPKAATSLTTAAPASMLVFDRLKFQNWTRFVYPPTSGVGVSAPYLSVIYAATPGLLVIGGGDGNVYVQQMIQYDDYQYDLNVSSGTTSPGTITTSTAQATWRPLASSQYRDANTSGTNNVEIVQRYRSRVFYPGDPCVQKSFREIYISGPSGKSVDCNVNLYNQVRVNAAGTPDEGNSYVAVPVMASTLGTAVNLPAQSGAPAISGASDGYTSFHGIQVDIKAQEMILQSINIMYQNRRINTVATLPAVSQ